MRMVDLELAEWLEPEAEYVCIELAKHVRLNAVTKKC